MPVTGIAITASGRVQPQPLNPTPAAPNGSTHLATNDHSPLPQPQKTILITSSSSPSSSSPASAPAFSAPPQADPTPRVAQFVETTIDSRTGVAVQRPNPVSPAPASSTREEGGSWEEVLGSVDPFKFFYFALLVIASTFICIITEEQISVFYLLSVVAIVALVSFRTLKL